MAELERFVCFWSLRATRLTAESARTAHTSGANKKEKERIRHHTQRAITRAHTLETQIQRWHVTFLVKT